MQGLIVTLQHEGVYEHVLLFSEHEQKLIYFFNFSPHCSTTTVRLQAELAPWGP